MKSKLKDLELIAQTVSDDYLYLSGAKGAYMSLQERKAYGKALALIQRHGMVAVPEDRMARLMAVIKAAEQFMVAKRLGYGEVDGYFNLQDAIAALGEEET
jgi:hypothetical protein